MTRQRKHDLLVTLKYNQHILATRRRPKVKFSQLLPNFLNQLKHAFTKGH